MTRHHLARNFRRTIHIVLCVTILFQAGVLPVLASTSARSVDYRTPPVKSAFRTNVASRTSGTSVPNSNLKAVPSPRPINKLPEAIEVEPGEEQKVVQATTQNVGQSLALPSSQSVTSSPNIFYDYDIIAKENLSGSSKFYFIRNPAINDTGLVAFLGNTIDYSDRRTYGAEIYYSEFPGSLKPFNTDDTYGTYLYGTLSEIELNNLNKVVYGSFSEGTSLHFLESGYVTVATGNSYGYYLTEDITSNREVSYYLAHGYWSRKCCAAVPPYSFVSGTGSFLTNITFAHAVTPPSINNHDKMAITASEGKITLTGTSFGGFPRYLDDLTVDEQILISTKGIGLGFFPDVNSTAINGEPTPLNAIDKISPMLADNGLIIVKGGSRDDAPIQIYDYNLNSSPQVLAGAQFTRTGNQPAISDDGKIVVFFGNRGNGPGLFLSYDDGAGFTGEQGQNFVRIVGENDIAPNPDIGYDYPLASPLTPTIRYFKSFEVDNRLGVTHIERGQPGIEDDSAVILFIGQPNINSRINPMATEKPLVHSAEKGLWTIRVDFERDPDTNVLRVIPRSPIPVAQLGDKINGATIGEISVHDGLALASQDYSGTQRLHQGRGDHRVAFSVLTDQGKMVIRASHLDTDEDGLLDHWETRGIDIDHDGAVDLHLAAMGANPRHKDLFLEIDWLVERVGGVPGGRWSNELYPGVTERLAKMFAEAPVTNPDGNPGIELHVDADPDFSVNMPAELLQGGDKIHQPGLPNQHIDVVLLGDFSYKKTPPETRTFQDIKDNYFGTTDKRAREFAFHYAVMADFFDFIYTGNQSEFLNSFIKDIKGKIIRSSDVIPKKKGEWRRGVIKIIKGKGAGQIRKFNQIGDTQLLILDDWNIVPATGDEFVLFSGSTGIAEARPIGTSNLSFLPGNDTILSFGAWNDSDGILGNKEYQWRTIAHELGHSLGLRHCGTDADAENCDNVGGSISVLRQEVTVFEAGQTDTYEIVLNNKPTDNVEISINSAFVQAETRPSSLTFTPNNWDQPQLVEVIAVDDSILEDSYGPIHEDVLYYDVTSNDLRFDSAPVDIVKVRVVDNEGAFVVFNGGEPITLFEGEDAKEITVQLSKRPAYDVFVYFSSRVGKSIIFENDLTVLRFTSGNWNISQTIKIKASDNQNVSDSINTLDFFVYTLESKDINFHRMYNLSGATLINNDKPGVYLTETDKNKFVRRGGSYDLYQVRLTKKPAADVVVEAVPQSNKTLDIDPTELTFTPANWSTPQTVFIWALEKYDEAKPVNHEEIRHIVTSADQEYASIDPLRNPMVEVDIQDSIGGSDQENDHRSLMSYAYQLAVNSNVDSYTPDEWSNVKFDFYNVLSHIGRTPLGSEQGLSIEDYVSIFGREPDLAGPAIEIVSPAPNTETPLGGSLEVKLTAVDDDSGVETIEVAFDANGDGTIEATEIVTGYRTGIDSYQAILSGIAGSTNKRTIEIIATDTASNVATAQVEVEVVPTSSNQLPQAETMIIGTGVGQPVAIKLEATDANAAPLTYSIFRQPSRGTLTGTPPHLTYTPFPFYSGIDSFLYRASDGLGNSFVTTVQLMIGDVDNPPILSGLGSQIVIEGGLTHTVAITATDPEGRSVRLSAAGLPDFATFTANIDGTARLDLSPGVADIGNYTGVITAADSLFKTVQPVNISVTRSEKPPVIAPIGNLEISQGFTNYFFLSATDPNQDNLSLSVAGLPSFASFTETENNQGTLTVSTPLFGSDAGLYPDITFLASDGVFTASQAFSITVIGDVGAPTLRDIIPANGGVYLSGLNTIHARFSEPLDLSSITADVFQLLNDDTGENINVTTLSKLNSNGQTVVTLATPPLQPGQYTIVIDAQAITDRAGNPLGNQDLVASKFTVIDRAPLAQTIFPDRVYDIGPGDDFIDGTDDYSIVSGDLDNDGFLDLVTANRGRVSINFGFGDGTFSARVDLIGGGSDVALGDINNDGKLDIVSIVNRNVSAWLGNGDGSFGLANVSSAASLTLESLVLGDVNKDGNLDVVAESNTNTAFVLTGNGDGTFFYGADASSARDFVALADLDGDSNLDLVSIGLRGDLAPKVFVRFGSSQGLFQGRLDVYDLGELPTDLAIGDLNDDGNPDLAVSTLTNTGNSMALLLNDGSGSFSQSKANYNATSQDFNVSILLGDANQDTLLDVILTRPSDSTTSVLQGNGDGTFVFVGDHSVGSRPNSAVIEDFNNDGNDDIATRNALGANISILLGDGSGAYPIQNNYSLASDPATGLAVADIDNDGILDIVSIKSQFNTQTNEHLSIHYGTGNGEFADEQRYSIPKAYNLTLGDFNNDSLIDIITLGVSEESEYLFINNGNSSFSTIDLNIPGNSPLVASGDLNSDGNLDLIFHENRSSTSAFRTYLGNGDGTFTEFSFPPQFSGIFYFVDLVDVDGDSILDLVARDSSQFIRVVYGIGNGRFSEPVQLYDTGGCAGSSEAVAVIGYNTAIEDINGDGNLDVVSLNSLNCLFPNNTEPGVSVLLGNATGSFSNFKNTAVEEIVRYDSLAVADFDSDGNPDVMISNPYRGKVTVLLGTGDGTFTSKTDYSVPMKPHFITSADLNQDGSPDFVGSGQDTVAPRLNLLPPKGRILPTANAGPDQTVPARTLVTLDGSKSDPASNLSYTWIQREGPEITLAGASSINPTFFPVESGTYIFELIVDDGSLNDVDAVTIEVSGQSDLVVQQGHDGETVTPDQTITYLFTVTNQGNLPANDVVLIDELPSYVTVVQASNGGFELNGQIIWPEFALDVDETVTRTLIVQVNSSVPGGVEFVNNKITAELANAPEPDPTPDNNVASSEHLLQAFPNLTVSQEDGKTRVIPDETYTYTITVGNNGNQDATEVQLSDILPQQVTFISASDGGTVSNRVVTWPRFDLQAGSTRTFSLVVQAKKLWTQAENVIVNTVTVGDNGLNGADLDSQNNIVIDANQLLLPDLTVAKDNSQATVTPGAEFTYTINIDNVGKTTATGVQIREHLSSYQSFVAASNGGQLTDGKINWPLFNLSVGESVSRTFRVRTVGPVSNGTDTFSSTTFVSDDGSNGPDPTPHNNQVVNYNTISEFGDLSISQIATPVSVESRGRLTYTLMVTNNSALDDPNVTVQDTLPLFVIPHTISSTAGACDALAQLVRCNLGVLPGTGSAKITIVVTPSVTTTTIITNRATVFGERVDKNILDNLSIFTNTIKSSVPDLFVSKSDGQDTIRAGQLLTYTILVTNTGFQAVSNLRLTDTVPISSTEFITTSHNGAFNGQEITWPPFDVAASSSVSRSVILRANDNLPGSVTEITNTVILDHNDSIPENNVATDTNRVISQPDLIVSKSDNLTVTQPGDVLTYTLVVKNIGSQIATGVVLSDTLLNYGIVLSASENGLIYSNTVVWPSFNLTASEVTTRAVIVQVDPILPAGINAITNTAVVTDDGANGPDPTPNNNTAIDLDQIDAAPDLVINKNNDQATALPGQLLTYTLTISNAGNQAASGVTITDTLPISSVSFISASNGGAKAGGQATWPAFDLPALTSVTRTVTLQVDHLLPSGLISITNSAVVTDDGTNGPDLTPGNNRASDTDTVVAAPDLVLSKDNGQATVQPGDTITYTLTISNSGSQAASGLVITDLLSADTSFITASNAGSEVGGVVLWPAFDLPASTNVTRTVAVRVRDPLLAGVDAITNTAVITDDGANGPDPTPANNSASDTDAVIAAPDLILSKDNGQSTVQPGDTVTYTLRVDNIGSQVATGVLLTDTLPTQGITFVNASSGGTESAGLVTWPSFSLAGGANATRTVTVRIDDPIPSGLTSLTNSASVSDDGTNGPDPTPGNNSASDTDAVIAAPDLVLSKDNGQSTVQPGDTVTYTLTISNSGSQAAAGVLLTDTLPTQGVTFVSAGNGGAEAGGQVTWHAFDLPALTSVTRTVTLQIDNLLPEGLISITNTAIVTDDGSNGPDPTPANNSASDTDTVIAEPDLVLSKDDGQSTVQPGDIVTYTLTISNSGSQAATGVLLTDTLPSTQDVSFVSASNSGSESAGLVTWPSFSLAGGASATRTVTVRVDDPLPAGLDSLTNTALVTDDGSNGLDPTPANNSASDTDVVLAVPDLVLSKDNGQSTVQPGDTVTYTLQIDNAGTQAATGILLTDTLPIQGVSFVSASNGGTEAGGQVTWPAFNLPALTSVTRTVTLQVDNLLPEGMISITNTAIVTDDGSNGPDPTPGNNRASDTDSVIAVPDLVLSKDDGQSTVQPGDTVTYTLRVDNVGPQEATDILLTDTLPTQGIIFVSASNGGSESGGLVTWPAFSLTGGASATRTVTVRIDDPLPAGLSTLTNSASVTDDGSNGLDPTPANNSASDTDTVIAAPDLVLSKDNGQSTAQPGDTVIYTLTISNSGSQAATGVLLTDTLPTQGVTFVSASNSGSENSGLVTWPSFTLVGGASATRTVTVRVRDPLLAGVEAITNTALVTDDGSNGLDPTPDNNSASDTDSVVAAPDLVLSKDNGQTTVQPGGTVTYTLRIDNAGSQAATGILLIDTLPTQVVSFVSAGNGGSESGGLVTWSSFTLAGGASATRTVTVRIVDPLPAGLSALTNTASVADDGTNGPDPTSANNSASDTDTVIAAPDLVLSKDNGQSTVQPGDTVTYTLRIDNAGSQAATGVLLTDTLPATQSVTFVSASNSGSESRGLVTWPSFSLAGGASATRTVTIRIDDPIPGGLNSITNSASVTDDGSNGPDPTPGNNSASDTDSVVAAPDLVLSKDDGQSTVQPGDTVTYTLRIGNVGSQAASGVLLTDTLPSQGVTFVNASNGGSENGGLVAWPSFNLTGGASATRTVTLRIDDPLPAGLSALTNLASVSDDGANGLDPTSANNSASDTDVLFAVPDLVLSKDNGQSTVQPGDTVTYTLTISNSGSQAATGVLLTDTIPTQGVSFVNASSGGSESAGLVTWPAFSLAGEASATRTVTVRVDDPIPNGLNLLTNLASVADDGSNGPDPTPANNSASDTDSIIAAPDLVLSKDNGQSTAQPGDTVTYTLRIDNAGSQAATGVLLTDTLPTQGITFVNASSGGSEERAGLVTWPSFSLAGGASATRTVTIRIDDPIPGGLNSITNSASVTDDGSNGLDPTPSNNSASDTDSIIAAPDLVLSKDNGQSTVQPGDTVTYTLRIGNVGSQAATGILLTDTLPTQGVTFVNASNGGSENGGLVAWPSFSLAGGASATRTVTLRIDDPLPAGLSTLTNLASVSDDGANGLDPTSANNSASDTDVLFAVPDLVLSKDNGQSTVQPGDTITYTLRIDNAGSQAATGILLTDTLPAQGVAFVSASNSGSESTGLVTWPAFSLAGGASATRTVTVRVDDPLPAGLNSLTNSASVSDDGSNGPDPTPGNNSASDTDTVNIVTYPPVLVPIPDQTLAEGTSLDVPLSATDADGDPISMTAAGLPGFASLTDNGDGTGLVSLAPGFTATGVYPDVTISASDGLLTDTQRFTITVTDFNRPPLAGNQVLSTPEDTPLPITLTGLDPDGASLTFSLVSLPISGTVGGLAPSLVYTPSLDFNGQDRFTYQANDGLANSQVATVTITVTPVNDPPDAVDDLAGTTQGSPVTIDVLANDSDPDGDSLTVSSVGQALSGTAILNPDDSLTYTPQAGFSGTDVFSYTIDDGQGAGDTALVSVQVAPGDALLPLCRLGKIRPGSPVEIELVLQDGQSGLSAINLLAETNAVATVPTFSAGTTHPVTVTVELDAIELVDVRVEAVDVAGNVSVPCGLSGEVVNSSLGLNYSTAYNNSTLTFSLFPTWQNVSGGDILAPVGVKVTSLYGSGCPCTVSDDAGQSGGVGTMFKTPLVNDLADGILSSGEQFRHDLRVQLSRRANFSFYVDVWGIRFSNSVGMSSSSLAASRSRASFKLEIEAEQLRDNGALYLPLIIKSP